MNVHRVSGYKRVERDAYQTIEAWVTKALVANFRLPTLIWEPAAGEGYMARALLALRHDVMSTDIYGDEGRDFLAERGPPWETTFAIVTNPPFGLRGKTAEAFIRKALELTKGHNGAVAMLLPSDFDHAASRGDLFRNPNYCRRIVLTSRPKWFAGRHTPKTNFVWHCWDHLNIHAPTIAYAGRET